MCITLCSIQTGSSETATAVAIEPSVVTSQLGEAFEVTVNLANVQNLYGLEVVVNWNTAVLQVTDVEIRLGTKSFPDGVLHESSHSPSIFIAENNLSQTKGEYRLVATSMAPATPFSGNGKIVILTFKPTKLGNSELDLESQLFDYPPTDRDPRVSLPIDHSTADAIVTVGNTTSSSPPLTPTLTPSPTSTQSSTSSPTPEPPVLTWGIYHFVALFITAIVIVALVFFALRRIRKH